MLVYLTLIGKESDKTKFEVLFVTYKSSMFRIANAILHDEGLAEDSVQESFFKLIRYLDRIEDIFSNKTRSFIVIIVRNISIDIYRKRKKDNAVFLEDLVSEPIDESVSLDHFILQEESHAEMQRVLANMNPKYAEVIVLKYVHGYNNGEIADILNVSNENVRVRLHMAKKQLANLCMEVGFSGREVEK